MVDLGVRLQQLRMDRNMSQSELGKALNRSKSVISAYENDLRIPPLEVLTEIALIFNVSLDFLVGIDKAEMVSVDGLNDTQKAIIHSLIYEFMNDHSPYPGLTEHQQKLLSQIMVEFSKK
jgi:DNA-binding helix-turn-helix protein